MADFRFQRDTNRFFTLGMDLNRPIDSLKELKHAHLRNVRSYQAGRVESRPGLTLMGTVSGAVHSIRRLNVLRTNLYTRVIGSGSVLSAGTTSFSQIDSGYSGNPLALVPYRPSQSPDPWMYCMDSLRQRKTDVLGNIHQVGIPPPTIPPLVARTVTYHKDIFDPSMSLTGWNTGPPFIGTEPEVDPGVNTTISGILYDSGVAGWCLIYPGIMTGLKTGVLITISGESVVVSSAFTGSDTSTTIAGIEVLPDGVTYSIVLSTQTSGVAANAILDNGGQLARAKAVIDGPNGIQTIISKLPAAWSVGDTIYIRSAIRCFTNNPHAVGDTILGNGLSFHVTPTEEGNVGYMISPKYNPPLDLGHITPDISSTPDSYCSIILSLSIPTDFVSGRIMLSSNDVSDPTTAFSTDFFLKNFTAADLGQGTPTSSLTSGEASGPAQAAKEQIFTPAMFQFKLSSLIPIGSPSLKSITYIELEVTGRTLQFDNDHPSTRLHFGSFYISGIPGPDVGAVGQPYIYRYRARVSSTGVVSNWSPATLEGFIPQGEPLVLTAPDQYILASEADKIDFQRRGGSIPNNWYYVGSVNNTASPTSFTDNLTDDVIIANPTEDQIHFQLWPIIGAPVAGTGISTNGVMIDGSDFSTLWAPQTPILINGTWYTIYQVFSTASLQLFESAGAQTNVNWEIPEPIIQGQPFPCFWGPLSETFFGCGDPVNPQRLYWTNPGDADTTQQNNWIDITTPSEPLINGVVYNGRSYAWSSERFFQIIPEKQDETGQVTSWTYVEIPNGKGLWSRWAFTNPQSTPGETLYFLSKDGIYATDGGSPMDATAEDMRPLFPHEGHLGEGVNLVSAPFMIPDANTEFRLSYYDNQLYFDYPDANISIPKSYVFIDFLNSWVDVVDSRHLTAVFIDNLNLWIDLSFTSLTTAPLNFTEGLNQWIDGLTGGLTSFTPSFSDSLDAWSDSVANV